MEGKPVLFFFCVVEEVKLKGDASRIGRVDVVKFWMGNGYLRWVTKCVRGLNAG